MKKKVIQIRGGSTPEPTKWSATDPVMVLDPRDSEHRTALELLVMHGSPLVAFEAKSVLYAYGALAKGRGTSLNPVRSDVEPRDVK